MRFITIAKSAAVVAALVAGQAHAAPVELITNGSFETLTGGQTLSSGNWSTYNNIDGWHGIDYGIEVRNRVAGSAYDGNNFVELDTNRNSSMWQAVTGLSAGKHYTLSFAMADRAGVAADSQGLQVWWNGSKVAEYTNAADWTVQTVDLVAGRGSNKLIFKAAGISDSYGTSLDKVSLVAAPIPEPETYGMLLAGLALVGAVARRKARKA
ncbi:FxDxF family PEP-CTERM protein [Pseudoduganella danionis]|uniref:PEP-CTERM sorting domain-containing protein n=1 Tax=Pseudoduganella danionis TaxID=1890295 RepID=A0ABW9SLY8_9BURK|nr:FxDxF family PEP-CTERM protein [Pseudoduganella danionis]MTW31662.1 PEP-CTERM sorting domain-containing protein [Pseudoduganella danionis]